MSDGAPVRLDWRDTVLPGILSFRKPLRRPGSFRSSLVSIVMLFGLISGARGILAADWQVSTPEEQNLDHEVIGRYIRRIELGDFGDIHSLLILRHGRLVTEEYFSSFGREDRHPVFSVTKSFTSAILGIIREQGYLTNLDTRLLDYFPEYPVLLNPGPWKDAITLRDVLTMTSGFRWNEASGAVFNDILFLTASNDWLKYVLDKPVDHSPGDVFNYNSGCTVLMAGVIRNETLLEVENWAEAEFFPYLDIHNYVWSEGADGLTNTGWGLSLRPRDMAMFGYMCLHGGVRGGRQIVPELWLEQSTFGHVELGAGYSYGYQWWMLPVHREGILPHQEIKIAWGFGGQFIFVIPAFDMVVVSTARNYSLEAEGAIEFIQDLLAEAVLDPETANGDLNADGWSNSRDGFLMDQVITDNIPARSASVAHPEQADFNGNGRLDLLDLMRWRKWRRAED